MTASTAPSIRRLHGRVVVAERVDDRSCRSASSSTSGWRACAAPRSSWRRRRPPSTSLAPLAREIAKATTGWPSSRAKVRGSAARVRRRVPSSSRRTLRPPGSDDAWWRRGLDGACAGERADGLLARRRSRRGRRRGRRWWRAAAGSRRPPVMPSASSRSGSSATRISRSTPPMRSTWPTPFTPCSARTTTSSTNQDSSSGVMRRRRRRVGDDRQAVDLDALTIGSSMVRGRSARMLRDGVLDVVERRGRC